MWSSCNLHTETLGLDVYNAHRLTRRAKRLLRWCLSLHIEDPSLGCCYQPSGSKGCDGGEAEQHRNWAAVPPPMMLTT